MNLGRASIIIRTHNERKHLGRLLEAIRSQTYQNFEIIIVDSGSTDDTLDIARQHPVRIVTLKPADFTFGRSLNLGCQKASGEYLVFVSAHTYPQNANWLLNLIRPFEDQKIAMVYGRQVGNEVTKLSEERDMLVNFGEKSKILVEEPVGNNANSAVRRSLWEEIPFDECLFGLEDVDWAHKVQKLGYYVYYRADAVIVHIHQESYRQIYRRFKREAQAFKMIFPQIQRNLYKECLSFLRLLVRDIYYALSRKRSLLQILTIVPYRLAELKGVTDAHQPLTAEPAFDPPGTYRRVVITQANQHQLQEPTLPKVREDEVLIKVRYAAVCSTDLEVLEGKLEYYKSGWAKYPIVPGHEFSGVVVRRGAQVRDVRVGAPVVGECILGCGQCEVCQQDHAISCAQRREIGVLNFNGGYAQYLSLPARAVHVLPEGADLKSACLIEPLAVCVKGINKLLAGEDGRNRKAAVVGFGTIGNFCAQILASKGYNVTVFENNPIKLNGIYEEYGFGGKLDFEGLNKQELIVEATGKIEALREALRQTPSGSKVLLLGLPYAALEFSFESLVCFDKSLIGSVGSGKADFIEALRLMPQIRFERLTRTVFKLEDYARAWQTHREGKTSKVLLSMEEV